MSESRKIYAVIRSFTEADWKVFVRTKLELDEYDVQQAVINNPRDVGEQQFQMIRTWYRKVGRTATVEELERLAEYESTSQNVRGTVSSQNHSSPNADVQSRTEKENLNNRSSLGKTTVQKESTRSDNGNNSKTFTEESESTRMKEKNACDEVEAINVAPADKKNYENSLKPGSGIYKISGDKKGLALILNNSRFDIEEWKRKGSEIDVKNMKELWRQMGCELYDDDAHCNKTAEQMKDLLRKVSTLESYSFLVIVIMTHGGSENNENYFHGSDGGKVKFNEVMRMFQNSNSTASQIPKLFILQFCRGTKIDRGIESDSAGLMENLSQGFASLKVSTEDSLRSDGARGRVPTMSDMLVAYATMDGYVALRDTNVGSWFINAITNVFMKHACTKHVADLLVMVQSHMAGKDGGSNNKTYKTMANHTTCLTKEFFLFPGQPSQ